VAIFPITITQSHNLEIPRTPQHQNCLPDKTEKATARAKSLQQSSPQPEPEPEMKNCESSEF
jgi:hypothetical protein